jgi:branched-chain amino acid aminotransferase
MLDWQGRVAECTGANVFFIKDGAIHTPMADCFLDGITRRTVIDLAKRRGFEVIERRIMPEELSSFNECFITGTAAEVTPVSEIGPYGFKPGNMTRTLLEDYMAEVQPNASVPSDPRHRPVNVTTAPTSVRPRASRRASAPPSKRSC